ncbi:MAG: ATP-binding protein [Pseudomonadota bacterium]
MIGTAVGGTLVCVGAGLYVVARSRARGKSIAIDILDGFIAKDASPSFVTDEEGVIQSRNSAANSRFKPSADETLASALRTVLANPTAVLYRLQRKAAFDGAGREDIVTRTGHLRLAVHAIGSGGFLWRIEDMPDQRSSSRGETLPIPMITVGRNGAILFMNEAARGIAGARVKSLDRLFRDLPLQPGTVNTLNSADGPVEVVVVDRETSASRREIYLLPSPGAPVSDSAAVFETLPVPLLKLSQSGEVLAANRMALGLLSEDGTAPGQIDDAMHGLGRSIPDWIQDTLTRHPVPQAEVLRLNRKDQEMFVQVTLSKVSEAGQTVLIGVLNDATELKTLEAQFVQSQKMQAIGQLAGGVAHDFNNLLTAISGHCDLLLLRHDQGDPDYGDLIQINQNANRAAALVGQLLAFSRKQTLRPEVIDLRDTLSDLTHLLNRLVGEKVVLTLSHDPVLRPIRADKRQLEQVLMNLVVNARDAMPGGGEIRIETEDTTVSVPIERDRAKVPVGDYVVVRVRDEGVGIPPDKLSKVFEPFYTTKRTGEGTGLGLSTAYGIIKQTGGFIFVDSEQDAGTCFTLYLPVFDAEPEVQAPVERAVPTPAPAHGEGVVLLVEDEAPVRAFASRALRLRGYTVLEAESAEDALATLEDPSLAVDIFITDVVMPGMDGPSWVRKALETRPDVRVVFVSGYTEGALSEADDAIPNSVFLPKPFSLNQLTETVHQQLH